MEGHWGCRLDPIEINGARQTNGRIKSYRGSAKERAASFGHCTGPVGPLLSLRVRLAARPGDGTCQRLASLSCILDARTELPPTQG